MKFGYAALNLAADLDETGPIPMYSNRHMEGDQMIYEIVVEGFVLDVEVTHCINQPPCPGTWDSDWDSQGERELEYAVLSGNCYDDDGVRMDCSSWELWQASQAHDTAIRVALWHEIDSRQRRLRRAA